MKGKIQPVVFRVMAVVSALAMGGGYVLWRQSEAEELNEKMEQARAKKKVAEMTLMVGSKNPGRSLISGEEVDRATIDEIIKARDRRTGADFVLPLPAESDAEPPEEKLPKLLPSSKSIDWILDNPNRKKSE